jgi:hypothetical protein
MCVVSMIVTFTWTFVQRTYFPEDYHIIQEQDVIKRHVKLPEEERPASQMFAPNKPISQLNYSGFAYEPGDEARLKNTVRKSAKSPPVSWTEEHREPPLNRTASALALVNEKEEENMSL